MKHLILLAILISGCTSVPSEPLASGQLAAAYFCPQDDCKSAILYELQAAEKSIHCALYLFTLPDVADLLASKNFEGVDVQILFEGQFTDSKWSQYLFLKNKGVPVREDSNPELMHSKYCIIDGKTVITGSFNWTRKASEKNDENLLILHSQELAKKYESNFRAL